MPKTFDAKTRRHKIVTSLSDLNQFLDRGWAIFPCHGIKTGACTCGDARCSSPGKHPRISNGVKGATNGVDQVRTWLQRWPDSNWAVATGEPSGVIVIDADVKPGSNGVEEFARFMEGVYNASDTWTVRTGGGGQHVYYAATSRISNRTNWLPSVDVRGDGGYVLLPGSSHASGEAYAVACDRRVAEIPQTVTDALARHAASTWTPGPSILGGVPEGERDDHLFRLACSLRRKLSDDRDAVTVLVLEAAARCAPPFPERDALVKVESAFQQDHSDLIDLDQVPFAAPDGTLYDFLAELDSDLVGAVERAVRNAKARSYAARVLREERVAKYGGNASMDGDQFMFGEQAEYVPVWGEGDSLLWAERGGLMIASDQGLGKSLTAQQIIAARLGVGPTNLLGLPITSLAADKRVVYLALDRPNQISRSMARLFTADSDRSVARDRLSVWTKPIPVDILGDPYTFADWLEDTFGNDIGDLVIDSVKDLTPANLSDGVVGQGLDMAWKECRARGVSTLILHHERKTGNEESRANRLPSLDNIYGSVWLTSGMDSILHIQGKQGQNVVTYTHLKHILNGVDPVTAMHDQENGRTEVLNLASNVGATEAKVEQVYSVIARGSEGGGVVSAKDVVEQTGVARASVDRYLKQLREAVRIVEASPYDRATATPATYRVA